MKDLRGTANFPENGLQGALRTIGGVVRSLPEGHAEREESPRQSRRFRSLILDGYIPTVRLVLCNNGARWTAQAQGWVREAMQLYGEQLEVLHFNHDAIVRSLQRGPHIDTTLT